jgi:sporulation protein YlmC with PRC-barrel domain
MATRTSTMMDPRVIPAKRVNGTDVYSQRGEHLGEIDDVMIDKRSGEVVYAIMSFGGFLGIGEKYHPLPWQVLTYDTDLSGYVVNVNEAELKKAPYYSRDELSESDVTWRDKVFGYYAMPPYWV